jgi:cell wall-associated NlpC family hydrolase
MGMSPVRAASTRPLKVELMNVSTGGRTPRSRVSLAALVCAIALLPSPVYAAPGEPGPGDGRSIEDIHAELDKLYSEAEVATEAYNTADEKATQQEKRLASLRKDLERSEDRVADLHRLAGAAARTQYRGGNLASTGIQLLLGDHPDQALDEASQARQALRSLVNVADAQETARARVRRQTDEAAKKLRELKRTRADKASAKKKIEAKIATAEQIEAGLKKDQTRQLAQLDKEQNEQAKAKWTGPTTGGSHTKVSGAAGRAVDFALAQIGKPYAWGAVGPSSYDCSGLTSTAWAKAGHPIPRTSQAQWQGLTRVGLSSVRPGDLIIYYSDAHHVGMYIGGGQMVHAPRTGRDVTIAPAASMPILGVVRPGV